MVANVRERADSQLHLESLLSFEGPTVKHLVEVRGRGFWQMTTTARKTNKFQGFLQMFCDGCVMGRVGEEEDGGVEEDGEGQHR